MQSLCSAQRPQTGSQYVAWKARNVPRTTPIQVVKNLPVLGPSR